IKSKVEVRRNKDDQLAIALKDDEIAKGTTLKLVASEAQMNALGFGPADLDTTTVEQTATLNARYTTEQFFPQLPSVLLGPAVSYDAARQVYTYTFNFTKSYDAPPVPLSFTQDFGPIGSIHLDGKLDISANVTMNLTIGFDLGAREV